jgi:predicted NAD/FAD-binding protein
MKIAVVGSGISGLAAALILSGKHEVSLYEADHRLGGHAHTVNMANKGGKDLPVDTAFLVYNTLTYPHFTNFLKYLDVKTAESDMSLAIQAPNGLEWAGTSLSAVFAQKKNILNFKFLLMLREIISFNGQAEENLILSRERKWTLADLVSYRNLGENFLKWYLLPMTGAIWSMSYAQAMKFPAETFLTFCINHHLLQVNGRPVWRTVDNGSINYVNKVKDRLNSIFLSSPVESIEGADGKLILSTRGQKYQFDKIVLATHAPVSKSLVQTVCPEMAELLSELKTNSNKVELHSDSSVMPKNRKCWSSWNVSSREHTGDESSIRLTYYLNKLQPLKTEQDYFITLNNPCPLNFVNQTFNYSHPQFNFSAIAAQKKLPEFQGKNGIYLAGAWTRYGFHEDGILSAVNVGQLLGCEAPWT